jgi:hypothetical protein
VTKGLDAVQRIEQLGTSSDGPPSEPVVIKKVSISES